MKNIVEIMAKVAALQELVQETMKAADIANAEYQKAFLDGNIAKTKAGKANAAAKAEEEAKAKLKQALQDLDNAYADLKAEDEAEEAEINAIFEMAKTLKPETAKKKGASAPIVMDKVLSAAKVQNRKNATRKPMKKPVEKKDETILQFRKGGIWAKRPIKSAKESAKWLRLLLDEQEAKKPMKFYVDLVGHDKKELAAFCRNLEGSAQFVFDNNEDAERALTWYKLSKNLGYFTSDEVAAESARRALNNAIASDFLGNPARKAAMVFNNAVLSVVNIVGEDIDVLCELGCKRLYEHLSKYNSLISDLEDQVFAVRDQIAYELYELAEENPGSKPELVDHVRYELRTELKGLKSRLAEMKAERRLIVAAIAEGKKGMSPAEVALADARGKVAARKAHAKVTPEGRSYTPWSAPEIKGFHMLQFVLDRIMPKEIKKIRNELAKAAAEWNSAAAANIRHEMPDDEYLTFVNKAYDKFVELGKAIRKLSNANLPFEADEKFAKVNNARQSELADVVGVQYGKQTDMIISLEHAIASFLPDVVLRAVAAHEFNPVDRNKEKAFSRAQKLVDAMEELYLNILTKRGLNVTFHGVDEDYIVHYNFWNANNSELKVGKCRLLSDGAFARAKEVAQAGMTDEEFQKIPTTGSDMLKWWSYATTPGCPMTYIGEDGEEHIVTANDVLVVDSITIKRMFKNVMDFEKDGQWWDATTKDPYESKLVKRTAFDGAFFVIDPTIPDQQIRGAMSFKGYGIRCAYDDGTTMIDEIALREGRIVPEFIPDMDGTMRRWRDYKIICTKDAWKWASYKISYAEFLERMNKLAEKYPAANMMYTARIADATEESKRHLTRQSIQMMMFASDDQIAELYKKSANKIQKLRTHAGIIRMMAGLDKEDDERTPFEWLVEVCPELLNDDNMKRYIVDRFNREVGELAVRPEVDGIYPYITEDPVAFFKIVFWGEDPDKVGLGYLKADEVNIPYAEEGKEMFLVRYPNNYLCGMIAKNHNDDIYRCCGNTMILSIDGYFLTRADGDVDGDEMCAVFNKVVIDMMKKVIGELNPPLILFPHDSLKKEVIEGQEARAEALAKAMLIANRFGPAVGQNSNMATKFMHRASNFRVEAGKMALLRDVNGFKKAKENMKRMLNNAIIAHIAAIIAIDLAKTGKMPKWLEEKLAEISKYAGKKMPWNQRFCKDNAGTPWFADEYWDEVTSPESVSVCDRGARYLVDKTDAYNYKAPTGSGFDYKSLLCSKVGLYVQGSKGKLSESILANLDLRNYLDDNEDGIDERKLIKKLHSDDEKDLIGFGELLVFLWRNQSSLMYQLRNEDDRLDVSRTIEEYRQNVRNIMLHFGSHCGNAKFAALSPEAQAKSNVWHAVSYAFGKNCVGKHKAEEIKAANPEADDKTLKKLIDEALASPRASFVNFVIQVFAYDIYQMVCENRGIECVHHLPDRDEIAKSKADAYFTTFDLDAWTAGCAA